MKKIILPTLLAWIILSGPLLAISSTSLKIIDPRFWGAEYSGGISEATLAVEPQGLYMKYDLFLTFSVTNANVNPWDSLEVEFFFDLPKEAIVCDSWLWIEDYISYGILMDVDSASRIYEDIVSRRTDPSILYKRSSEQYELRIFPITIDEPRKVKITFLLPMEWTSNRVLANLPLKNIMPWLSEPTMNLIVKNENSWQNPLIVENPTNVFTSHTDSLHGDHFKTELSTGVALNLTLGFDSPMNEGVYVSYDSTQPNEGFYQMAFLPSEKADSLPPTKTLFLLDYQAENGDDFRVILQEMISNSLSPKDSFNLMLKTPANIVSASPNWLPADSALIDSLFDPSTFSISPTSSLLQLLAMGLQYMTAHNNEGSIVLYSNNDGVVLSQIAEDAYSSLAGGTNIQVPIHIANHQYKHIPEQWDPSLGKFLRGNEYLFGILADRSGGSYRSVETENSSIYLILRHPLIQAQGSFDLVDIFTHTLGGVCYDRHQISPNHDKQPIHSAILQTGKYYGSFPFSVDFFYLHDSDFQFIDMDINQSEMDFVGESVKKGWAGNEIQSKDLHLISSELRQEIVDLSIEANVLSTRTAFLCLEDSTQNGILSHFEIFPVGVDPLDEKSITNLEAFPNPFQNEIQISIENLQIASLSATQLQLLDIHGKVIHDFELASHQIFEDKITFEWNGSDLPSGIYLLTFKGSVTNQTIKLVKQ